MGALKEVTAGHASSGLGPSTLGHRPRVRRGPDGREIALHICIIDFLQKWTMGKRVARVIKVMEQNKATVPPQFYADRFRRRFERSVVEAPLEKALTLTEIAPQIAPCAGDNEVEGEPETQLHSRMNSRAVPDGAAPM